MTAKITEINAALLTCFLQGGSNFLAQNKEAVNALNVFPVPDGDTGINMHLTVNSAVKNITGQEYSGVGELSADFAMGALMGARGNSGVILSQIFRGFSQSMAGKKTVDAVEFAQAMQKGVDLSYKSVMKPVEGTILTVFRHFAAAAAKAAQPGGDIAQMMRAALAEGEKSLQNTPELLPVLKEAGVVDAGGQGMLLIMEGGLRALTGEPVAAVAEAKTQSGKKAPAAPGKMAAMPPSPPKAQSAAAKAGGEIEFTFDIQMLIKGENVPLDTIRERLSHTPPGDCLLVVGTPEVVKIHFHSNLPWQVLEYAAGFGTLHDIVIENMSDQHEHLAHDEAIHAEAIPAVPMEAAPPAPAEPCATAVIAVCAGEGLAEIFSSMGAAVISGGQTMNPSAEDLLTAIAATGGAEVVLLPNNSNIILTAQQAQKMAEKPVHVVPSKFVTQGLTALLSYDKNAAGSANAEAMNEAILQGMPCEVTYAVRESKYNGFDIQPGDVLGLKKGEIVVTGKELSPTVMELLEQVMAEDMDYSLISFFYGNDMTEAEAAALAAEMEERWPEFDVEYHEGGQPLYYLLLSVE